MSTALRRFFLSTAVASIVSLAGVMMGCTEADNPKLPDVPQVDPGTQAKEAQKKPGNVKDFNSNDLYKKHMSGGK